jgi:RND family efflux transporter MFP subunit
MIIDTEPTSVPSSSRSSIRPQIRRRLRHGFTVVLAAAAALAFASQIYSGIRTRVQDAAKLQQTTEQSAVLAVDITHPQGAAPTQEVVLPGSTQAFVDSPIYARTSGYLKNWYFDIGARVKQGDLLAEIETPEIDQQLRQARADLDTALANRDLAQTTADRWQFLQQSGSVSKQETDQTVSNLRAQKAAVESNSANVRRLEDLQSFEKVYAPFDGVITVRSTDIGALINAGAGTPTQELFHMASIDKLRLFVAVPEVYSRAAQNGAKASVTLDEFPGETFSGTLVRNSNSIDPASRTLNTEVDVDNPTGRLLPGAYVSVHLKLPEVVRTVTIPANTLLFRSEGLRVGVVRNEQAVLVPITIGRDFGSTVEVVSGLDRSASVILNPTDSLITGTPVRVSQGKRQ